MTIAQANRIRRDYYSKTNPTEEERFAFFEALDFLIKETKNPEYMMELGGEYYGEENYDLALKYYEMAAEYDNMDAIIGLGYIWYYGRTGEKNYEKAFYYYDKARKLGNLNAAYKVADMYKNGYYVEKDYEKYKSIIEELYPKVRKSTWLGDPVPEVFTRLAKIRSKDGKVDEALKLYDIARDFLAQRIRANPFFGNLSIMKWMIGDIYKLREFDSEFMNLYDMYYLLLKPVKVGFTFKDDEYSVEAVEENGEVVIKFGNKWYRTVDDFFAKAQIDGNLLTTIYEELHDFTVD